MENENTEYKDGDHNSFIEYVFENLPKEKNSIKLELDRRIKTIILINIFLNNYYKYLHRWYKIFIFR